MTGRRADEEPLNIQGLLGIGLDGDGKHKRVTRGDNFYLFGGSEKTHDRMVDTAVRFNDLVDERGKKIDEINARELIEIRRKLRDAQD
jgi:hypothetical protein